MDCTTALDQSIARSPESVAHHLPARRECLTAWTKTRLANANHLTISEVLAVLAPWFATKVNNRDDRAQHHMLVPATAEALRMLARLASATPAGLARALPAFGATDTHSPLRATTACHRDCNLDSGDRVRRRG